MSFESNVTILRCDWRNCTATLVPSINKGRRDLRALATEAGWRCTKRGQWTDLCPEHADTSLFQREAI